MSKPWSEVQSIIIERATRDDEYRRRLLEDPVAITESERGERFPETVSIKVIESEPETGYIPVPQGRGREALVSRATRSGHRSSQATVTRQHVLATRLELSLIVEDEALSATHPLRAHLEEVRAVLA